MEMSYPDTVCNLNGNPIENVKKFRYLGNDIQYDQSSTGDAEVDLRIAVAREQIQRTVQEAYKPKVNLHTRVLILNSIVRSRLVYSVKLGILTNFNNNESDQKTGNRYGWQQLP